MVSLNLRGVGGAHKQLSLKILVDVYNIDVVFLQETMCSNEKVIDFLSKVLKDWTFCTLDVVGMSRGFVTGWNTKLF
jgi:hypothetical protein